tara:strand:+ start:1647 stop:1820 length:174 start_codon:yes stop_codon:yes gene_type:complete
MRRSRGGRDIVRGLRNQSDGEVPLVQSWHCSGEDHDYDGGEQQQRGGIGISLGIAGL